MGAGFWNTTGAEFEAQNRWVLKQMVAGF